MMSWLFGGGQNKAKANADKAKKTIIDMRGMLDMLEKREKFTQNQIDQENAKAKSLISTNKKGAAAAIKRRKALENTLEQIQGQRLTVETQVNALENANVNLATLEVMKQGASAMKAIHGAMNIDKVDSTMDQVREQIDLANEVSDAISQPIGMGAEFDQDDIEAELEALEQEDLDNKLMGSERPRTALPVLPTKPEAQTEDEDEAAELAALQASMEA